MGDDAPPGHSTQSRALRRDAERLIQALDACAGKDGEHSVYLLHLAAPIIEELSRAVGDGGRHVVREVREAIGVEWVERRRRRRR